uniref:Duplex-specific nuclease n=1 Tax=Paralithodes camtschaticus TaxID=6741 RepID=Q8I9M9_PARCM|nr:duplex-specific nuclease [Paralithodes camtschaticus]
MANMESKQGIMVLGFLIVLLFVSVNGQDCVWDKDTDFPEDPPLIFDSNLELIRPVLENGKRIVSVPSGSSLTLACSGSELINLGMEAVEAKCAGGVMLAIEGTEWEIWSLGCSNHVKETIRRNLGTCGEADQGDRHSIGFEYYGGSIYYELISVCFGPVSETTLRTEHVLHGANIAAKDIETSRPSFKTSTGFFSVSMSTVYSQASQLQLMTDILGDSDLANNIIDPSQQLYFAKGHMSPDADFVTVAEQDATYYFINALPQWQAFNNGNWKYLEYATRDLAESHGSDLRVYSGGWSLLQLDDINGNPVDILLGLSEGKEVVPVPSLTWKVVYEESSSKAAAIVGINNPHITTAPSPLCSDLCSSLTWIDFNLDDLAHGYTYCCAVDDLRQAIPYIPDLGNVGLLTN